MCMILYNIRVVMFIGMIPLTSMAFYGIGRAFAWDTAASVLLSSSLLSI